MKDEHPILFSAPMVRAILAGQKTVTRRVMKPQPYPCDEVAEYLWISRAARSAVTLHDASCMSPYGVRGDRLWVKETHGKLTGNGIRTVYRADSDDPLPGQRMKWSPSIFMRRCDSRILLEVEDVRCELLHDITEADAKAEGVTPFRKDPEGDCWTDGSHRTAFEFLWNEINGWEPNSWASNPWVWRVSFRVSSPTGSEAK